MDVKDDIISSMRPKRWHKPAELVDLVSKRTRRVIHLTQIDELMLPLCAAGLVKARFERKFWDRREFRLTKSGKERRKLLRYGDPSFDLSRCAV